MFSYFKLSDTILSSFLVTFLPKIFSMRSWSSSSSIFGRFRCVGFRFFF